MTSVMPYAHDAERAVIGAMLMSPESVAEASAVLCPEDFYVVLHRGIFAACVDLWRAGQRHDVTLVAERLRATGVHFENPDLIELLTQAVMFNPTAHCLIVAEYAARRRVLAAVEEMRGRLCDPGADVAETIDRAKAELDRAHVPTLTDVGATTWDEFCGRPEPAFSWAVPGLIDIEDRVVIVAPEGMGKTVLLRQLALAAGQGIHPFTFEPIPAVNTLLVDLENPGRIVRSKARPMLAQARLKAGDRYEPSRTWIWHRPGGINLRTRAGVAAFDAVLARTQPSLVCLGPLYKAYRADSSKRDHDVASEVAAVLDDLRTRHQFALVIEAHAPLKQGGTRDLRPFGSLLWQQWPEQGIKLVPEGEENTPWFGQTMKVGTWRGGRDERQWPSTLTRGTDGTWPWIAYYPDGWRAA